MAKEVGFRIYATLLGFTSDNLPEVTTQAVQYKVPGMDDPRTVTQLTDHIRQHNGLTLNE